MEENNQGWVKSYRKSLENPVVCKDAAHFAVWNYLLLNATHRKIDVIFSGERISLEPGQLIVSRKTIAEKFKISESKVQRILNLFESEQQIEQLTTPRKRLVAIRNWIKYQGSEQLNEQLVNNYRTTSEQLVNANKNEKNIKNVRKNIYPIASFSESQLENLYDN